MKPGIHPDYHPVVFQDANTGALFLTRSTIPTTRTIEWDTPTGVAGPPPAPSYPGARLAATGSLCQPANRAVAEA